MEFRRIKLLSDVERGFLAGIFEGEGTICIFEQKKGALGQPILGYFLQTSNTCKELIEYLRGMTGIGKVLLRKSTKVRRQLYDWRVTGHKDVLDMLETMHPYLWGKKRQAEIAYQLVSSCKRNNIITPSLIEWRRKLQAELKQLLHPSENKLGEFGKHPTVGNTEPSSDSGEGVEVSPEIKDISAQPVRRDEMTRTLAEAEEV